MMGFHEFCNRTYNYFVGGYDFNKGGLIMLCVFLRVAFPSHLWILCLYTISSLFRFRFLSLSLTTHSSSRVYEVNDDSVRLAKHYSLTLRICMPPEWRTSRNVCSFKNGIRWCGLGSASFYIGTLYQVLKWRKDFFGWVSDLCMYIQ